MGEALPSEVNLQRILNETEQTPEPEIPYPQANDLDKVFDLVNAVDLGIDDKVSLADYFEFDERQGDYYANAAMYLDLVCRESHAFRLTDNGRRFIRDDLASERNRLIIRQMAARPTLRRALYLLIARNYQLDRISNAEIATIIEENTILTGSTPPRRASTIRRWLKWLLDNNAFVV